MGTLGPVSTTGAGDGGTLKTARRLGLGFTSSARKRQPFILVIIVIMSFMIIFMSLLLLFSVSLQFFLFMFLFEMINFIYLIYFVLVSVDLTSISDEVVICIWRGDGSAACRTGGGEIRD